ncbi:hypothetical protein HXX76_001093 [Chlamydomonas incerta]|uniref:Uncharacterized protein n=1 Tax=Chlamydomonas incerta TaxID=51695 RepID=A0A836B117_CHLIN|nr:hypothetical protein HXX76_001093 [Chlamydomonas incerta]|eukprot:KAG2444337.1 hypothetical protein HXX76_001093 [Chlamydomonas incerta]
MLSARSRAGSAAYRRGWESVLGCPRTIKLSARCWRESTGPAPRNLATTNQASTARSCFSGASAAELEKWLERGGVDTGEYGKGLAKTVHELFDEVSKQESVLELEGGKALRIVNVLSLHILNSRGQILFEDEQVLPDGRSRRRNVPVSEKMVANEPWHEALDRAVKEELSSALPEDYKVTLLEEPFMRTEYSSSMSYPGLLTKYIFHRVKARVSGIPESPFSTTEERPGGFLLTRWVWKAPPPQETF